MNYFTPRNDRDEAERLTLLGKHVVCISDDDEELIIASVCGNRDEAEQFIALNQDDDCLAWFIYSLPRRLTVSQPDVPDWDDSIPF